jgi:hypothetical protein
MQKQSRIFMGVFVFVLTRLRGPGVDPHSPASATHHRPRISQRDARHCGWSQTLNGFDDSEHLS